MFKFFKGKTDKDEPLKIAPQTKSGWSERLKSGLSRSSNKINEGFKDILIRRKLDSQIIEEIEELLIASDMGASIASSITSELARDKFDKDITAEDVKVYIADKITTILQDVAKPLKINTQNHPHVLLVCGVNGSGKTTTIGKLAKEWQDSGKKVMLAACDTFRAAAIEQLEVWAQRSGCAFVKGELHSDPASVAYTAFEQARAQNIDILIIDTAGRLQNKKNLMEQLSKLVRVIKKADEKSPHDTIIVLDATTVQNANSQVKIFKEVVDVTGIIITKLDGTAKGGVLVSLAGQFGLPIHAIGVGESADDLKPFQARDFANNLLGV
jgi:fused signal recognition particle receptor